MKATCLQPNFYKALTTVARAASNRTSLPVTQNILIEARERDLKVTGTNLEICITTTCPAMVEEPGEVTLPAKLLTQFINVLPEDRIDIEMEPGTQVVRLTCSAEFARIYGISAQEFPPVPQVENAATARITAEEFKHAISRVSIAAAKEESRPVLCGVHINMEETRFTMAAADGFRLAVQNGNLLNPVEEPFHILVRASTMNELSRLTEDMDTPIEIMAVPNQQRALFRIGPVELFTQLINGQYPNYDSLIPTNYKNRSVFNTSLLKNSTKAVSLFDNSSKIIRLELNPNEVSNTPTDRDGSALITSFSEDIGIGNADIPIEEMQGPAAKIAINRDYIRDLLNVINEQSIVLETMESTSPGVFKTKDTDDYIHVIMPMFVQWDDNQRKAAPTSTVVTTPPTAAPDPDQYQEPDAEPAEPEPNQENTSQPENYQDPEIGDVEFPEPEDSNEDSSNEQQEE